MPTRPLVTYALEACMLLVSLATLLDPALYSILGGTGAVHYPWQAITYAFEHGWPSVPLLPHLAGNLILLHVGGPAAEKLLGPARYLALTLIAILFAWLVRAVSNVGVNGASVFIYAYPPVLWYADRVNPAGAGRYRGFLVLVWLMIPLAMGLLLFLNGVGLWRALFWGNIFHLAGTLVGFGGLGLWRAQIAAQSAAPSATGEIVWTRVDRAAVFVAFLLPLLVIILLLFILAAAFT